MGAMQYEQSGRSGAFRVFNTPAQTDNLMSGANRVNMQTAHEGKSGRGGDTQMRKKGGAGMKDRAGNTQEKDRISSGLCKRVRKFPASSSQSGAEGFVLSVLSLLLLYHGKGPPVRC